MRSRLLVILEQKSGFCVHHQDILHCQHPEQQGWYDSPKTNLFTLWLQASFQSSAGMFLWFFRATHLRRRIDKCPVFLFCPCDKNIFWQLFAAFVLGQEICPEKTHPPTDLSFVSLVAYDTMMLFEI